MLLFCKSAAYFSSSFYMKRSGNCHVVQKHSVSTKPAELCMSPLNCMGLVADFVKEQYCSRPFLFLYLFSVTRFWRVYFSMNLFAQAHWSENPLKRICRTWLRFPQSFYTPWKLEWRNGQKKNHRSLWQPHLLTKVVKK